MVEASDGGTGPQADLMQLLTNGAEPRRALYRYSPASRALIVSRFACDRLAVQDFLLLAILVAVNIIGCAADSVADA